MLAPETALEAVEQQVDAGVEDLLPAESCRARRGLGDAGDASGSADAATWLQPAWRSSSVQALRPSSAASTSVTNVWYASAAPCSSKPAVRSASSNSSVSRRTASVRRPPR